MHSDPIAEEVAAGLQVHFEGFYSRPYLCPAGVPTIGFGFTHYPDGTPVTLADPPLTKARALEMLDWFNRNVYIRGTRALCPALAGRELGAISDFSFNCGLKNLRTSTLRRKINAGALDQVPAQLRRWTRGGGKVLRGLVLRREAEAAYFNGHRSETAPE